MRRSGRGRRLTVVAALVVALGATPGPAHAGTGVWLDGDVAGSAVAGSATGVDTSPDHLTSVTATVRFTGVIEGNGLRLVLQCDAVAAGAVASTGVQECYAEVAGSRYDAPAVDSPGNVAVTAATPLVDLATVHACVSVRAVPVVGEDATAARCTADGVGLDLQPPPDGPPEATEWLEARGFHTGSGPSNPFGCVAVAGPTAVKTQITRCSLYTFHGWDAEAPPRALPGPSSATVGRLSVAGEPLSAAGESLAAICWEAEAEFVSGRTVSVHDCLNHTAMR